MENVFIVPAKDAEGKALVVPDPIAGGNLPGDGGWKPRNQYWLRRLRAGDVTEAAPPQPGRVAPVAPKRPASEPAEAAPTAPVDPGK